MNLFKYILNCIILSTKELIDEDGYKYTCLISLLEDNLRFPQKDIIISNISNQLEKWNI
jgi:hypothetical protein